MSKNKRPKLSSSGEQHQNHDPVKAFVAQLQTAVDQGDAQLFNQAFAEDVLWGSPFGAVVSGYEHIHAIHSQMFSRLRPVPGTWDYSIEAVSYPQTDLAIAYIRRQLVESRQEIKQAQEVELGKRFDELALIILIQREGQWWLAAAQHVPDRREVYHNSDVLLTAK